MLFGVYIWFLTLLTCLLLGHHMVCGKWSLKTFNLKSQAKTLPGPCYYSELWENCTFFLLSYGDSWIDPSIGLQKHSGIWRDIQTLLRKNWLLLTSFHVSSRQNTFSIWAATQERRMWTNCFHKARMKWTLHV